MAIKIIVPNKNFNGFRGGFKFMNGIAIVEDEEKGREFAKHFGYEIEEDKTPKDESGEQVVKKTATSRKRATKKKE